MVKAAEIFNVFLDARYIVRDTNDEILVTKREPEWYSETFEDGESDSFWAVKKAGFIDNLGKIDVEELRGEDYECMIERDKPVKTPNDLIEWLNECECATNKIKGNVHKQASYMFKSKSTGNLYIYIDNKNAEIKSESKDRMFIGKPSEVKHLLEMLM